MRAFVVGMGLWVLSSGCGAEPAVGLDADAVTQPDGAVEEDADAAAELDVADAADAGPTCAYAGTYLVPGPCEPGFDAVLEAKATRYERVWRAFNAAATGVNTDVSVALDRAADRALVEAFAAADDAWDFEAFAGKPALDVVTAQHKVAGLYAGVGLAADAFRYGVLRDQGYPAAEVDRARAHLLAGLEGLRRAVAITGTPGVIARGYARTDLPGGEHHQPLPLFDDQGQPLPAVKNNGTWREDLSGEHPGYLWEDSVSRDMMLGWVTAFVSVWEVTRDDPSVPDAVKQRLRADGLALARELKVVRASGYDLEIPDADGRTTLHGWLNENNLDGQLYLDGLGNGFHALMALGFVASWVYLTEDPELDAWLQGELIGERRLHELARDNLFVSFGLETNFSNYNMAFGSAWLALRYLDDPAAAAVLRDALAHGLYAIPGDTRQPVEMKQSYFDFIYAAGLAGLSPGGAAPHPVDAAAVARGLETLADFPEAPYWSHGVVNCPAAQCGCDAPQVDAPGCVALDGTPLTVLGCVGRGCALVAAEPVPMRTRGPSNYHWRTNPYQPNLDGDGDVLLPGVDFRIAYWLGRWARVTP